MSAIYTTPTGSAVEGQPSSHLSYPLSKIDTPFFPSSNYDDDHADSHHPDFSDYGRLGRMPRQYRDAGYKREQHK